VSGLVRPRAILAALAVAIAASSPGFAAVRELAVAPAPQVASSLTASTPVCDSASALTMSAYLPNVTKTLGGPDGWDTPFYVQNAGAVQTTVESSFYRFSDGAFIACHKRPDLPPGASLLDDPNVDVDLPADTQFSVVVRSYGAPVAAVVHQLQGSGRTTQAASYSGFTVGATTVYLPNVTRRFYGYDVPFIVQDLATAPATVTASFISFDGSSIFITQFTVQPGRSAVVDPDYTDGLQDGTQYAVTLRSTQPIGVVMNAHNESLGPLAYSHDGLTAGANRLYAPYAVKGGPGGMFSPIVVQNVGPTTTDVTLAFAPIVGGAAQSFALASVAAGASRAFDPRFTLGTTIPCAAASATCLGPGEYSLTISAAGPIAAVVLPNTDTTAGAYLAATELSGRAIVPVAMRNVGGTNGWSSSMYLLSAVGTAATLRYYRTADGTLSLVDRVDLVGGSSLKVDTRKIAALADNERYAVTIEADSGGALTAVAMEQALTGGDALMVSEGAVAATLPSRLVPGSIAVRPATAEIGTGGSARFSATVKDQYGVPLNETPAWSTSSNSPGAIGVDGVFHAGSAEGSGSVRASAGAVSASAAVTVAGLAFYRMRFDFSTSSDWSTMDVLPIGDALSRRMIVGPSSSLWSGPNGELRFNASQPIYDSITGHKVGITFDVAIAAAAWDRLRISVVKGALGASSIRVSRMIDATAVPVARFDHPGDVETRVFALPALDPAAAPPSNTRLTARQPKMLLAHYYPWYHLDMWTPPYNGSPPMKDQPLSLYESGDAATIERHIAQAKSAGIDGFFASWWGPNDYRDDNLRTVFSVAAQRGFVIAPYVEIVSDRGLLDGAGLTRWLEYFLRTYGSEPALMRVGGRPVIPIWQSTQVPLSTWRSVFADLRSRGFDAIYLALSFDTRDLEVFDGFHAYGTFDAATATYARVGREVRYWPLLADQPAARIWAASAEPGYDDRAIPGRVGTFLDRRNGATYREALDGAAASDPDWILITSWNEWWENTHIEPSVNFGDQYVQITREFAARWKQQ